MLPTGRLREFSFGSDRADVVVVSKCPEIIDKKKAEEIKRKLKIKDNQELYFSEIVYDNIIYGEGLTLDYNTLINSKVLLITGIANPKPLIKHVKSYDIIFKHLKFVDHHDFSSDDILMIEEEYANLGSGNKVILTTEKDYVRLNTTKINKSNLMYLPISIDIMNGDKAKFDKKVRGYVENDQRNS